MNGHRNGVLSHGHMAAASRIAVVVGRMNGPTQLWPRGEFGKSTPGIG